ncbi:MAG: hypothetical protein ACFFC7_03040 [Candidatus Hermodarchaeota archaeon]
MSFATVLNKIARLICVPLLLIVPLIVVGVIVAAVVPTLGAPTPSPNIQLVQIAWLLVTLLLVVAVIFIVNALIIRISFKREINRLTMQGKPVRGIEGFEMVNSRLNYVFISSVIVFLLVLSAFIGFTVQVMAVVGSVTLPAQFGLILLILATGFVFMSIGITVLVELPFKPAFEPGGLLNLYKPSYIPMILDNLLSDTVFSILDPATRIFFDEWTEAVKTALNPKFETEADTPMTRLERAREKILLLTYFKQLMPKAVTEEIFEQELKEVIREDAYEDFIAGKASGISLDILKQIIHRTKTLSPEIFTLVDQITMELMENPANIAQADIWATMGGPSVHYGTLFPFRVLGFVVNKSPDFMTKKRPVDIKITSGRHSMDPDKFVCHRELDEADDMEIPLKKLPFASKEGPDVLDLVTRLLQVGDAFWFQFRPNRMGFHPVNLEVYEENHQVAAKSLSIMVRIDIKYLAKTYGGRIAALIGAVIPFATGFL